MKAKKTIELRFMVGDHAFIMYNNRPYYGLISKVTILDDGEIIYSCGGIDRTDSDVFADEEELVEFIKKNVTIQLKA